MTDELKDTILESGFNDEEIAKAITEKAQERKVYDIGDKIRIPTFADRSIGEWYERWNETLLSFGEQEENGVKFKFCSEEGYQCLIYPFEVADEIMHIRMQSWKTLRILEFLINFWYATTLQGDEKEFQKEARTPRNVICEAARGHWVNIKLSAISLKDEDVIINNEYIAKAVEALRHDTVNNGDEHHLDAIRLIPYARIYAENGEPILSYDVDWDLARLGFKDFLGEVAEAWENIKYREAHGLWTLDGAVTAVSRRKQDAMKEEYQKWVMTGNGEAFRRNLKNEAVRMGKDWETMTDEERKDFILNEGFGIYCLKKALY